MPTNRARQVLRTRSFGSYALLWGAPLTAVAQASPFMTGATALETNILAWLTPIAMHLKMEQRGVRSELAERLRADYRERLQRRAEHVPQRREAGITAERVEAARTADQAQATGSAALAATRPTDAEEIRRQAREAWLRLRAGVAQKPLGGTREATRAQERAADGRDVVESEVPVRDDDLAL